MDLLSQDTPTAFQARGVIIKESHIQKKNHLISLEYSTVPISFLTLNVESNGLHEQVP